MTCAEMREAMPAYVRDGEQSLAARRHLARCADCKAELARYELLLGTLGDLATTTVEPPPNLAQSLAAIPSHTGPLGTVREHVTRNRNAYLGGVAIAAAGAAGAAVWRRRRVATA
ncbi:MAG: anti-sigma factor family protein [Actinomycetota bacterium]